MHAAALLVQLLAAAGAALAALAERRDLDPQTCLDNFDVHRDKIIRTEDSREMGAKYLNEVDLGSRDECLRLCCETDTCDVFVFEEKSPGSCYLFHCGPPEDFKCKFTRHTNFSSAVLAINRHLAELEDQIKLTKHEQDLASLRKQYQETVTTAKTTTTMSSMPVRETPAPFQSTRRCSRYQFECHSSEECIAIYNACDGIPQCADGSDEAPELGCPATTTLPPPPPQPQNLPPRELLPHMPQMQQMTQYNSNIQETIPMQKEIPAPHPPAFMPPMQSQDTQAWPRRLEQIPPSQHMKQYENLGSSHIFNHKGGLQRNENDGGVQVQYDYKPIQYDPIPDSNWEHRTWQQPPPDANNMNDGSAMYHIDMDPQNPWKQQQPIQNIPMQHRIQNNPNQMPSQRRQPEKMNVPEMPNMFQDRDKMWAVPQLQNQPEKQQYNPMQMIPQGEESFETPKVKNVIVPPTQKPVVPVDEIEEPHDDTNIKSKNVNNNNLHEDSLKENKANSKHAESKSRKKHLQPDNEKNNQDQNLDIVLIRHRDDVHDGAAERPPGAILLLTLGVCMTSIMIVLLGCRLKMARRRMRKNGKSPFAHDADYLVNGMYL